jgi:hypothetical protein
MELNSNEIEQIVDTLQHADGEDIQDILIRSGWNDQMLRQLMMCEPIADVEYVYKERLELENQMNRKKYWIFESC